MEYQEFIDYQSEYLPFGEPEITQGDLMYFEFNNNWRADLLRSANFYVEAIQHNAVYLKVPAKVIFISDFSHNARASVFDGRGLIVWHGGLLLKQMEILDHHQAIWDALSESPLSPLLPFLDNDPSILFFQMVQSFTFYHEFGHIIQIQERPRETTHEYTPGIEFNQNRHILEIDADEFSSIFLASHVMQYVHTLFYQVNQDIVTRTVALFLVPILTDSISIYPDDIENISLEEGHHPHPIFRILFIAMVIADFVNQRYRDQFVIEHHEILNYTVDIASTLSRVNLVAIWANHHHLLMAYFKKLRETDFPEGYKSAVDAWNEEIEHRMA